MTALVLYIPVLHEGYIKIFNKYKDEAEGLFILGNDIVRTLSSYHKEIRGMEPAAVKLAVEGLRIFKNVSVVDASSVQNLKGHKVITADEQLCRQFAEKYLPGGDVVFDPIFLRWDSKNITSSSDVKYDRVSRDSLDREMVARASSEADKSSDWWRHVGAVLVKDGTVILEAHNHHVPSEHTPYAEGDPRDSVEAGTLNLVYTSLHAEQTAVAEAARKGVPLEGASIYMNIFPCPLCAKLVAYAGIKKIFFQTGSAWLDAESILKANGVEIVLVK